MDKYTKARRDERVIVCTLCKGEGEDHLRRQCQRCNASGNDPPTISRRGDVPNFTISLPQPWHHLQAHASQNNPKSHML